MIQRVKSSDLRAPRHFLSAFSSKYQYDKHQITLFLWQGYAYIEYKLTKQAQDAQTSMNLFELCGKQLRIGRAIAPPFEVGGKKPEVGEIGFVIPKLSRPIRT